MPNPIESLAVKGAGKVAGVEAYAKGLKGVFVTLAEQHREAATLLSRAESTKDISKRRDLWAEIKKQLVSHERAELAEIYPAIALYEETQDVVKRHAVEAAELESTINQLDATGMDSPRWNINIERLAQLVKQHALEEENEFFPRAQEVMDEEEFKELENAFLRAKEREMASIH